jgi:hypothetical protein
VNTIKYVFIFVGVLLSSSVMASDQVPDMFEQERSARPFIADQHALVLSRSLKIARLKEQSKALFKECFEHLSKAEKSLNEAWRLFDEMYTTPEVPENIPLQEQYEKLIQDIIASAQKESLPKGSL